MVDLKTSELFNMLLDPDLDFHKPDWIDIYRLFCYGFRCGGFVDILAESIEKAIESARKVSNEQIISSLTNTNTNLQQILGLRIEPIPKDLHVVRRFFHYERLFMNVLESLEKVSNYEEIKSLYEIFKTSVELVTSSNGLYILDWNNPFLLEKGAIDLPDQGIKIIQGLFTDDFSVNYALVSPDCQFYHAHSELWEFHFIDNYDVRCLYEHIRAGKRFKINNTDIISMRPGIPHGGYNPPNSIPVMLGFVAGDARCGPWRFDFNDRSDPENDNIIDVTDIKDLNGVILNDYLEKLKFHEKETIKVQVVFPHKECQCDLEFVKVGKSGYKIFSDKDLIVKIMIGQGKISIGSEIEMELHPQCSFVIPSRILSRIESKNMILMKFS